MRLLPLLLCLAACVPAYPAVLTQAGSCGGVLTSPTTVLTSAHCALPGSVVECDGQRVTATWDIHPKWAGSAHDVAVGHLSAPLACDVSRLGEAHVGSAWYRGQSAAIVEVSDGRMVVDIAPRRFCRGDSGRPVEQGDRVVGLVSSGEGECSERATATTAAGLVSKATVLAATVKTTHN